MIDYGPHNSFIGGSRRVKEARNCDHGRSALALTYRGSSVKTVRDLAVPALVAGSMVVVRLGLTAEDFRRARRRRLVLAATPGEILITSLVGQSLVRWLTRAPATAVTVLGRVEFAAFASADFVRQRQLAVAAAAALRRVRGMDFALAAGGGQP